MKKIFSLFAAVLMAGSMMAATSVYEHTFSTTDKTFTADGAATLSDVSWTLATTWVTDNKDYNRDTNTPSQGMKLGSNSKAIQTMTLTTSGISGVIDSIYFETNARSGAAVAMSVTVGGTAYTGPASFTGTGAYDTRSKLTYKGNKSGEIVLSWDETDANASKKGAFYLTVLKVYSHTEAPATGWDGTVTTSLDNATITGVEDFEGIVLTLNGATSIAYDVEYDGYFALQNEDGSEAYAFWYPAYGSQYTVNGDQVTLTNWYTGEGTVAIPDGTTTLYLEDYGVFDIDGEIFYVSEDNLEFAYASAPATTYTVTYTVNGFDAEHCLIQAGYYNADMTISEEFVAGANTVPENMIAYISTTVIDDYTVEVKVNGAVVTLTNGNWQDDITDDMTIEVTFAAPQPDYNFTITDAEIVSGKVGDVALNTNNYGSQAVATESTWYTFEKGNVEFKGAKVCVATDANGGGIQVQGNTDVTKQGFIFNNTAMPEITAIAIEFRVVSTSTYDPNFHLYVGDAAHPTATAVEGSFTKTLVGGFNKYVYTFAVEGAPSYFTIANDLAGALYIDAIKVAYKPTTPTALENLKAEKAVKVLENGKVVIIKNGVKYNVMGKKL